MGRLGVCALFGAAICACSGARGTNFDGGTTGTPTGGVTDGTGTGASFMLALTPGVLSITPGNTGTVELTITRQNNFMGTIELSIDPPDVGVLSATQLTGNASVSVLRIVVPATALSGSSLVSITARSGAFSLTATLELTITAPAEIGLVDDDGAENSAADQLFPKLLRKAGLAFAPATRGADLRRFRTLLWYTGKRALSAAEQSALRAFLDEGDRTLIFFSSASPPLDDLGSTSAVQQRERPFNLRGSTVMTGLTLSMGGARLALITPKPGTDTLFSTTQGTEPVAIAVARKGLGAAASSKAVFFGFPLEEVIDVGTDAKATAFQRVLAY